MASCLRITGWGKYLPEHVLTNRELEKMVDTSDEWIVSRTGIRERRIASNAETASFMATAAAHQALQRAGVAGQEVDIVIVATSSAEYLFPPCASLVQSAIGAGHAAAFDLNAACSGFVYALATASQFLVAGSYKKALVVGSEVLSRVVDWTDRNTCILFGDGAGAVVLEADATPDNSPFAFLLGSDGSGANLLYARSAHSLLAHPWANPEGQAPAADKSSAYLQMQGQAIFRFAVTVMAEVVQEVTKAAGIRVSDIDLLIPHQANERILSALAKALQIPLDKVYVNLERYGNTSAASVPIAICEAAEEGRLRPGDCVALVGFGGGLSWAAMVMEWQPS